MWRILLRRNSQSGTIRMHKKMNVSNRAGYNRKSVCDIVSRHGVQFVNLIGDGLVVDFLLGT